MKNEKRRLSTIESSPPLMQDETQQVKNEKDEILGSANANGRHLFREDTNYRWTNSHMDLHTREMKAQMERLCMC